MRRNHPDPVMGQMGSAQVRTEFIKEFGSFWPSNQTDLMRLLLHLEGRLATTEAELQRRKGGRPKKDTSEKEAA